MNYNYSYLVRFQYLGFRLHGWQKQPNLKTVHFFVDKTLKFVCKGIRCKSVGVGRTDAKVSSTDYCFQLFIDKKLDESFFIEDFNRNSPSDIRVLVIEQLHDEEFNIIQHPKIKEYRYYFSFGEKNHPYCAPFLTGYLDELDVELMKEGARLFEGFHNFKHYCTKPSTETRVERTIEVCKIEENTELSASFFPEKSYVLIIRGSGFLRNQIRLIMGALAELGKGNYDLEFIKKSLSPENSDIDFMKTIAPASGLHLHKVEFKKE
ncbi:tRNA pseudouridine(38-40) synthase TruA [Tenacibaculum sp. XPcli2-G]|uniref:tRNA pseudouridine(38-40) synthase TruA n=1 Tax=Tenacibaculum sp. XPcli2-G TaxID=2954503 RepID=UPI002096B32C|nr:tRNA pseudouridine(38-40) synthase TruA [Tenacibaculum sp. XPcli2-G]MCO7186327.1 tRNA pseudouridine(38-40) synthase TruA [Tenacibaculum sp. XPcli2-G]